MFEYASQFKVKLLSVIAISLISLPALSQVQVVDAAENATTQNSQAQAPAANSSQNNAAQNNAPQNNAPQSNTRNNDIVLTLYNTLEALQREVQILRGLVEEQSYQIRQMEQQQRDRYLDVDNRLSELNQRITQGGVAGNLSTGPVPPASTRPGANPSNNTASNNSQLPGSQASLPSAGQPGTGNSPAFPAVEPAADTRANPQGQVALNNNTAPDFSGEPRSEEELYQEARNFLLNDGDYEASISVFQQMIEEFPQGRLAPNAYYWQGEALILVERYSQAINVFNEVIDNFPTHEKAPDSMLKLGIVYSLMENESRAQEVWRNLLTEFGGTGSASLRLAELYLRDGYNR